MRRLFLGLLLLPLLGCRDTPPPSPEPPPAGTPRLLVFLVVDQMRADYLGRIEPLLAPDGGFRRLLDDGVVFTEAHHGHARTYTGPGHAALATGEHPRTSGIVGNEWFDRERRAWVDCVVGDDGVVGPGRVLVPSIGDWVKARYPAARVVAASGKDRGAVLPGGHAADAAFWWDEEAGRFVTSSAYGEPPGWLAAFNARGLPRELFAGASWEPLPVDPGAAEAAGFAPFDRGPFEAGLPRLLGGFDWRPTEDYWTAVYASPFLDQHLARLARTMVEEEALGADEWPDLLALSFSSLDAVGHRWGPASLEALDTLLRLDRALGELFAFLDLRVGRGGWAAGLSADHGVAPVPEVAAAAGGAARRAGIDDVRCLRHAVAAVEERFGDGVWAADDGYLDRRLLAGRGLDRREVEAAAEAALAACPGIDEVWTAAEIAALAPGPTPASGTPGWLPALYRNTHHPERSPDLLLQNAPGFLPLPGSHTTHASPHPHDTHVPFVVLAPGVAAGRVGEPVFTVDFAPTLARLVDVPLPAAIAGRDRLLLAPSARE